MCCIFPSIIFFRVIFVLYDVLYCLSCINLFVLYVCYKKIMCCIYMFYVGVIFPVLYFLVILLCCIFVLYCLCCIFVWFVLCYIFLLYFPCVKFCVIFFVLYSFVVYVCVVLKSLYSLQQILLISVWQIFSQNIKKKVFLWVRKLGLIHYLIIFLNLFLNCISAIKLNCLLRVLLLLKIFSLHKWYCPIRISIAFHSHCYCIIKFIFHHI